MINVEKKNNTSNSKHIACYDEMIEVKYICTEVLYEKTKWNSPCDCNHK